MCLHQATGSAMRIKTGVLSRARATSTCYKLLLRLTTVEELEVECAVCLRVHACRHHVCLYLVPSTFVAQSVQIFLQGVQHRFHLGVLIANEFDGLLSIFES